MAPASGALRASVALRACWMACSQALATAHRGAAPSLDGWRNAARAMRVGRARRSRRWVAGMDRVRRMGEAAVQEVTQVRSRTMGWAGPTWEVADREASPVVEVLGLSQKVRMAAARPEEPAAGSALPIDRDPSPALGPTSDRGPTRRLTLAVDPARARKVRGVLRAPTGHPEPSLEVRGHPVARAPGGSIPVRSRTLTTDHPVRRARGSAPGGGPAARGDDTALPSIHPSALGAMGIGCFGHPRGSEPHQRKRPRRRPIFPRGCPLSIFGAGELNFRVRDGNGCGLSAKVTRIFLRVIS